jgi:hypothetical protein
MGHGIEVICKRYHRAETFYLGVGVPPVSDFLSNHLSIKPHNTRWGKIIL